LKIVTFYADCELPQKPLIKQKGFDWRKAIGWLRASAERQGYETLVVTDTKTDVDAWLRVGDARESGLMLWILEAQAQAIRMADGPAVMVSPDSLVMGKLDALFGDWDVSLLTRRKPKPIVNSVIGFTPSERLHQLWLQVLDTARNLPAESKEWGADIDAVVDYMSIQPLESGVREVAGVKVGFIKMDSVFTSVRDHRPNTPIWDFKGNRKQQMHRFVP
jgi:hypothetical protein